MEPQIALAAAKLCASGLGLMATDALVLQDANRMTARLLPCDTVVRVAPETAGRTAAFEVEMAQRLAETDAPAAVLDSRVEPVVYEADGFVLTFWKFYKPTGAEVAAPEYAAALERLHAGMSQVSLPSPHFTDRVA